MDTAVKPVGMDPMVSSDDSFAKVTASRVNQAVKRHNNTFEAVKRADIQSAQKITEKIQGYIDRMNVSLKFSTYGKNNDKMSVTVIEKGSGKVVREIPPEEIQRLQTRMEQVIGLIFNGKA